MSRFPDVDPGDLDPETGRPYANYSSPSLDTSFHDAESAGEDEDDGDYYPPPCSNPGGHEFVIRDHPAYADGVCRCVHCNADGDA